MGTWETANGVIPTFTYRVRRAAPPTLITEFEDGSEVRRQKSGVATSQRRTFEERHRVNKAEMELMLDFYEARGLLTNFTKYSYDANDPTNTNVTVRFLKAPTFTIIAVNIYEAKLEFIEVLGE